MTENNEERRMPMNAVKLRPFVPSGEDYSLAQSFFEDLGFEKVYSDNGISIFRKGEAEFFLQHFHNREFQDNYMMELRVDNLDEWWSYLQSSGLEKKYPVKINPPKQYPWGSREIHLIDPAGVCWHISEAAKTGAVAARETKQPAKPGPSPSPSPDPMAL
jgi:hypothetical protein